MNIEFTRFMVGAHAVAGILAGTQVRPRTGDAPTR